MSTVKEPVRGYNMAMASRLKKALKAKNAAATTDQLKAAAEKAKNRAMAHVRIDRDGNRCVAKGEDAEFEDDKISAIMSLEKAQAAIKSGAAKAGDGW